MVMLPLHLFIDPLETDTALYGANGEPGAVMEAGDSPCLPFEGRGKVLVELCGLVQIIHTNMALSSPNDQQVLGNIHGIAALRQWDHGHGSGGSKVPVLQGLVPGTRDKDLGVIRRHPLEALNRLVMSIDGHGLSSGNIKQLDGLVSTA